MAFIDINNIWNKIRDWYAKYGPNKYVIACVVFAIVILFVGEQSIVKRIHRGKQIAELEEERETYQKGIDEAQRDIDRLQHTDSLIKYARERYYMHTADEDVYIIKE